MYNEVDTSYLDEKIKNIGLPLSYIYLQTRKADSIKKNLESFANNKIQNNYYKLLMQKYQ